MFDENSACNFMDSVTVEPCYEKYDLPSVSVRGFIFHSLSTYASPPLRDSAFPQRAASPRAKSISNRVLSVRRKCSPMAYGSDSSSCYVELVSHVNVAHCEWDILIHVPSP